MNKIFVVFLLLFALACETGLQINTECVMKHTAETLRMETTASTVDQVIVNLSWYWVWSTPESDGVIIERSLDTEYDSIAFVQPVESLMTFFDTDTALHPDTEVSYRLSVLTGQARDEFCTLTFTIPGAQHFYAPDTEIVDIAADDSLEIIFSMLSGFDSTSVALYETSFSDIDSLVSTPVDELVDILMNPLVDTVVTDTVLYIPGADTLIQTGSVYVVKVTSSKILEFITDTSIGLRPFVRNIP
jgi:hypothetical protein